MLSLLKKLHITQVIFWVFLALKLSVFAKAGDLLLDNLDQRDIDNLTRELSANFNFTHTLVTPANSLGHALGFEAGALVGATYVPRIGEIVRRTNPQIHSNYIPHAAYVLGLTMPLGITLEGQIFPTRDVENVNFGHYSGALKWTPTAFMKKTWYHVAFKFHGARTAIDINQVLNNASTQNINVRTVLQIRNLVWGSALNLSLMLGPFRPYIGGGYLEAKENLYTNGPDGVTAFTTGGYRTGNPQHALGRASSAYGFVGFEIVAFFFHWGAEYTELFQTKRVTTKISFGI